MQIKQRQYDKKIADGMAEQGVNPLLARRVVAGFIKVVAVGRGSRVS